MTIAAIWNLLREIFGALSTVLQNQQRSQSSITTLDRKVDKLSMDQQTGFKDAQDAIKALADDIGPSFDALQKKIDDLVGAGAGQVTGEQLEGLASDVNAVKTALDKFRDKNVAPVEPPTDQPPVTDQNPPAAQ